jgi:protein TonB
MNAGQGGTREPVGLSGLRTFIVPPDIVPVRRVSPLPVKKRTLCKPRPDGQPVHNTGGREWFSERVFVECTTRDVRRAYGSAITAHASCLIGLLVLMSGRPVPTTPVRPASTPMPAFVAVGGGGSSGGAAKVRLAAAEPRATPRAERRVARAEKPAPVEPRPLDATPLQPQPIAAVEPVAEPATEPEVTAESETGTPDGVAGGVDTTNAGDGRGDGRGPGGGGAGTGTGGGVGSGSGPYRLGRGIEPPRKIKDVVPVYTSEAMAARVFGTVTLEAVVGADGKIDDVKVLRSIPLLDRAAIDCVRQWEFAPARMNGQPVAVIVTILVQFSIR